MSSNELMWRRKSINHLLKQVGNGALFEVALFVTLDQDTKDQYLCLAAILKTNLKSFFLCNIFSFEDGNGNDIFETIVLERGNNVDQLFNAQKNGNFEIRWNSSKFAFGPARLIELKNGDGSMSFSLNNMSVLKSVSKRTVYEYLMESYFISGDECWKFSVRENRPDGFQFGKIEF